jgi:hypothetical protein
VAGNGGEWSDGDCVLLAAVAARLLRHIINIILHLSGRYQWLVMVVNGLIGTVLSELLWLLGCFDTLLILFSIDQVATSGWQWW